MRLRVRAKQGWEKPEKIELDSVNSAHKIRVHEKRYTERPRIAH